MKKTLAVWLVFAAFAPSAQAEPVPQYVLDKDFTTCMGGANPQADPERGEYCACVRDSMKGWSMEAYGQLAMEGAKAHSAAQEPAKLQEIAKVCIAKALGNAPQ